VPASRRRGRALPVERALAVLKSSTSPRQRAAGTIAIPNSSRSQRRIRLSAQHQPDHRRDLQRSGLFAPIDPAAFIEKFTTIDSFRAF